MDNIEEIKTLIKKFQAYEISGENELSLKECHFLLENEEIFGDLECFENLETGLFSMVLDFKDYLEEELQDN